jgi:hypothetical protein
VVQRVIDGGYSPNGGPVAFVSRHCEASQHGCDTIRPDTGLVSGATLPVNRLDPPRVGRHLVDVKRFRARLRGSPDFAPRFFHEGEIRYCMELRSSDGTSRPVSARSRRLPRHLESNAGTRSTSTSSVTANRRCCASAVALLGAPRRLPYR